MTPTIGHVGKAEAMQTAEGQELEGKEDRAFCICWAVKLLGGTLQWGTHIPRLSKPAECSEP